MSSYQSWITWKPMTKVWKLPHSTPLYQHQHLAEFQIFLHYTYDIFSPWKCGYKPASVISLVHFLTIRTSSPWQPLLTYLETCVVELVSITYIPTWPRDPLHKILPLVTLSPKKVFWQTSSPHLFGSITP